MHPEKRSGLARLVGDEARLRQWEERISADPARIAAGWTRRFVVDASRCEEMVRLYRDLGYEVVADPVRPEDIADECDDCQLVAALQFRLIYTRPQRP